MYQLDDQNLALLDFYLNLFAGGHAEEEGGGVQHGNITELIIASNPIGEYLGIEAIGADGFISGGSAHLG